MIRFGEFFASVDECSFAQWEKGGCGLTLRVGFWLLALGHLGYREKYFPRWLRFGLAINGPRNQSMSNRPIYYLYAFGLRLFDTSYWEPKSAARA